MEMKSSGDSDRRVIEGWAALEHGNLEAARAALRDVYQMNPNHPALPMLAAGIRRARGTRVPWRALVLLIALVAAGVLGTRVWMASRSPERPDAAQAAEVANDSAPPSSIDAPPQAADSPANAAAGGAPKSTTGTSGGTPPRVAAAPRQSQVPSSAPAAAQPSSDDAEIRQAIARFATAYSSRWTRLSFSTCHVAPGAETTTATCQARVTDPAATRDAASVWTFSCRKIADVWKIISVQPPAGPAP